MELVNETTGYVLAERVEKANTFGSRLRGLMFRKEMSARLAMHLTPCRSIHTFFMRFPIDVLYLNKEGQILKIEEQLAPNKMGQLVRGTESIIELPVGTIQLSETKVGHYMKVSPTSQTDRRKTS